MASRRRQEQGGKPQHAEGMHGTRTHEAIQEQLKHVTPEPVDPVSVEAQADGQGSLKPHVPGPDGKHRLTEARVQHDEADHNSDKNRLARLSRGRPAGGGDQK